MSAGNLGYAHGFAAYATIDNWLSALNVLKAKHSGDAPFTFTSNGPEVGGVAPSRVGTPNIIGFTDEGDTLSLDSNTWFGSPVLTYQWKRGGVNIAGATGATYDIVTADLATNLTCAITATNHFGSTTFTTAALSIPGGA
jgi:hypothetical protein